MIITPIDVQISCLKSENIHHSCHIGQTKNEIHLWDMDKLDLTLETLQSRGVNFGRIIRHEDHYFISF